ncbi:MAG: hypothetical protein JSS38_13835 [Nitrospira sp.]|nr:hypothetical protein [Nitrospira sp.]
MRGFKRLTARVVGVGLGCVIGSGVVALVSTGWATELAFVARDVEDQQAVWLPGEIVLHRSTDFAEPLIFRFTNPTVRTHVFEAPGLFESVEEEGIQITRPLRVTIAPEESEQIVVDRSRITSDARAGDRETVTYRFYCPLHRADDDTGGTIVVEP